MTAQTLHSYLKQACDAHHQALHHHPLLQRLFQPDLSKQDYIKILSGFYQVYQPIETTLDEYLEPHALAFNYQQRRKCPSLLDDLHTLNARIPETEIRFDLQQTGQIIGVLYVLEGSSLGGQVITRALQQQHPELPVAFFNGYGSLTGGYWQTFLTFAEAFCPYGDRPIAAQAAIQVFDALLAHFDRQ